MFVRLLILMIVSSVSPPPEAYEKAIRDQAATNCSMRKTRDPELLSSLLEIENKFNFPPAARGLLTAAACRESSDNPKAEGDCILTPTGRRCRSQGMFQFFPYAAKPGRISKYQAGERPPGDPRHDHLAAARYWAERFMRGVRKVREACKFVPSDWNSDRVVKLKPAYGLAPRPTRSELYGGREAMIVAAGNAHAVWAPACKEHKQTKSGKWYCAAHRVRCKGVTRHWRELRKWQQAAGVEPPSPDRSVAKTP